MGYDLRARNSKASDFHFGAFSWPVLLEQCGCLWPFTQKAKWYCVFGVDSRMPVTDRYPRLISNDGFRVTAFEAKVMARMARNYVAIQRSIPDLSPEQEALADDMNAPDWKRPWPRKIRTDFVDRFEEFAEWAEKSGGFAIH